MSYLLPKLWPGVCCHWACHDMKELPNLRVANANHPITSKKYTLVNGTLAWKLMVLGDFQQFCCVQSLIIWVKKQMNEQKEVLDVHACPFHDKTTTHQNGVRPGLGPCPTFASRKKQHRSHRQATAQVSSLQKMCFLLAKFGPLRPQGLRWDVLSIWVLIGEASYPQTICPFSEVSLGFLQLSALEKLPTSPK